MPGHRRPALPIHMNSEMYCHTCLLSLAWLPRDTANSFWNRNLWPPYYKWSEFFPHGNILLPIFFHTMFLRRTLFQDGGCLSVLPLHLTTKLSGNNLQKRILILLLLTFLIQMLEYFCLIFQVIGTVFSIQSLT